VGVAAFWIALAAVMISSGWFNSRREAMKHETIRQMVEKTGRLDEAALRELFPPRQPLPPHWFRGPEQGMGYRTMRVFGTLWLFVALGLAICFSILYLTNPTTWQFDAPIGFGVASVIALVGAGLFAASTFLPKPLPQGDRD